MLTNCDGWTGNCRLRTGVVIVNRLSCGAGSDGPKAGHGEAKGAGSRGHDNAKPGVVGEVSFSLLDRLRTR